MAKTQSDQPKPEAKASPSSKPKPKPKRSKIWIVWTLLIIVFSVGASAETYLWQRRTASDDRAPLTAQITSLENQITSLKKSNTDLQSQLDNLKSSTTDLDETAITTRVKYVYTQWLANVTGNQASLINTLKNGNYLTASLASTLQTSLGGQSDPVLCAATPANTYVYGAPLILTTTAASMVVTGDYMGSPNETITLAMVKDFNTWEIDSISCS